VSFLVDTNVLSELRKPRPNANVIGFIEANPLAQLFVSVVNFGEIRFGIELQPDPIKRSELQDWFTHKIRPMFDGRLLLVTEDIMFRWSLLREVGRKANHTFSQPDLIIAATALEHGLTLVTRNTADFARTPVQMINPWLA